jgi:hypothetical protein
MRAFLGDFFWGGGVIGLWRAGADVERFFIVLFCVVEGIALV